MVPDPVRLNPVWAITYPTSNVADWTSWSRKETGRFMGTHDLRFPNSNYDVSEYDYDCDLDPRLLQKVQRILRQWRS